jgi:hypothetical protein
VIEVAKNGTAYCPTCSRQVTPVKKTNWLVLIVCAVFGGVIFGTIAYCIYQAFIKKADTCPHCKKKVLPIIQAPAPIAKPEPYCPNCGTHNDADAEFCINCGQKLASIVPNRVVE